MSQSDKSKSITIDIPSGYEIDKANSTFERIVFKSLTPILPKRWEDLKTITGYYIDSMTGQTSEVRDENISSLEFIADVWPTRELAEASIALAQLCQLRDVYNDGWVRQLCDPTHFICVSDNTLNKDSGYFPRVMQFKSLSLRDQFFTNFKDLLEIAKPLL